MQTAIVCLWEASKSSSKSFSMSAKSIPKVAPFPPFVLDSYRMLYLEKSG